MNLTSQNQFCIACGHNLSTSNRYSGLLHCINCEFLTADTNLSDADLAKIYGKDYFHDGEYGDYIAEKSALQYNFAHRLKLISSLPSVGKQSKIFEIGCAYGFFLELLNGNFFQSEGIDIAKNAVEYAKNILGLKAHHGNFLKFTPDFSPNVICMWDVIEHLKNPREILERANQISAPNGHILITTGDIKSLNARIRGPKWRLIHPPTHLHYFSKKSITKMLNDTGYENVQISYPAVWRSFGSIMHAVLDQVLGLSSIANFICNIPGNKLPIPLNLFDIMLVTAQKKAENVSFDQAKEKWS